MAFVTKEKLIGFGIGVGAAAAGFYLYKKNEMKVHDFLRSQGLDVPGIKGGREPADMTLEELVTEKEKFEDLIAEKELLAKEARPKE